MQDKSASSGAFKNEDVLNQELSGELHKRIIRKFERRKVYSPFTENVLSVDFADMILISNFNKGICFLSCIFGIFTKHAWVFSFERQKMYYNY